MADGFLFFREAGHLFFSGSPLRIGSSIVLATALAILGWGAVPWLIRSINVSYRLGLVDRILQIAMGAGAFALTLGLIALGQADRVVVEQVTRWEKNLEQETTQPNGWESAMIAQTYWEIRSNEPGIDFRFYPAPGSAGYRGVPQGTKTSLAIAARVFAEGTVENFKSQHPFLTGLIHLPPSPIEVWKRDRDTFWRENPGKNYIADNGIRALAGEIRRVAGEQAGRIVLSARLIFLGAGMVYMVIVLGLLAGRALSAIKVFPSSFYRLQSVNA